MKEKILKNCKKYWYVIAFIIVGFIVLNKEPDYLVLKKNTFKVELGTPFNIKPETYLNTEKLDTDVKKDVLENAKVTVDKDLNNIENFCLDVGKYKVTVSYKNEKETFTYKVEDTTAPVITGAESIDIVQSTDLSTYDFKVLYTIDDLSQTDVKYDTSAIDAYTLKIISEDNYGNKCDKEVAINVVAPLSADEVIVEEIVSNADGTTTTKIVTRKKTEAQSGDFRIVTSGDTSKSSNNSSYSSSSSSSNSISTIKPSGSTSSNSSSNNNSSAAKPNNGNLIID